MVLDCLPGKTAHKKQKTSWATFRPAQSTIDCTNLSPARGRGADLELRDQALLVRVAEVLVLDLREGSRSYRKQHKLGKPPIPCLQAFSITTLHGIRKG